MVYPNIVSGLADGTLYMDDGQTHKYLEGEQLYLAFNWNGSSLTITKTCTDAYNYPKASGIFINKAQIFNITAEPIKVKNTYMNNLLNQNPVDIDFMWNSEEASLTIHDFLIPVDAGLTYNNPVTLFEVIWQ